MLPTLNPPTGYLIANQVGVPIPNNQVTERDLKGLKAISDNHKWDRKIVISQDPEPRNIDGIEVLPVRVFLEMLWSEQI
jgi:hypothetical protein